MIPYYDVALSRSLFHQGEFSIRETNWLVARWSIRENVTHTRTRVAQGHESNCKRIYVTYLSFISAKGEIYSSFDDNLKIWISKRWNLNQNKYLKTHLCHRLTQKPAGYPNKCLYLDLIRNNHKLFITVCPLWLTTRSHRPLEKEASRLHQEKEDFSSRDYFFDIINHCQASI